MSLRHAPACLTGLLVTLPLLAPTSASAVSDEAIDYRRDAIASTNAVRENRDRSFLRGQECLQGFARRHAARMAAANAIWHQDLQKVLATCDLSFVGENVAAGFPSGRSAVRDGWMKSDSHRENILEPSFTMIAVAARRGGDGRWYAGQLFGRR